MREGYQLKWSQSKNFLLLYCVYGKETDALTSLRCVVQKKRRICICIFVFFLFCMFLSIVYYYISNLYRIVFFVCVLLFIVY